MAFALRRKLPNRFNLKLAKLKLVQQIVDGLILAFLEACPSHSALIAISNPEKTNAGQMHHVPRLFAWDFFEESQIECACSAFFVKTVASISPQPHLMSVIDKNDVI